MPAGSTTASDGMPQPDAIFVDRNELLVGIRAVLDEAAASSQCAYVHLHGGSGVGKTELALKLAKLLEGSFPDGAWYVGLGNVEAGVLTRPAAYLRKVLDYLPVSPADLDDNLETLSSVLRNKVLNKRVLIVVDDVVGPAIAEHFRLQSPGSLVLLISRDRWTVLPSAYVRFLVEPLTESHAAELVQLRLSNRGLSCPASVSNALVASTAGLPQLITVGAETLASLPTGSEDFLRRMVDGPVREDLMARFRQIYDVAYDSVSGPAKRVYRLLSLHPLPEFSVDAAMAVVDATVVETVALLRELAEKSLLQAAHEGYRFHASAWGDAKVRRDESDSDDDCPQAIARMLWFYLEKSISYEKRLSDRWRVSEYFEQVEPARAATRDVALEWLEQNREILSMVVSLAHDRGFDRYVVAFCEALWSLLHLHNHFDDWRTIHDLGLKSAERAGLALPLMHVSLQLVSLEVRERNLARAAELVDVAQRIAIREGHVFGQQSSLEWKARVFLESGDYATAVDLYGESIQLAESRLTDAQERARAVALGHFHRGRAFYRWRDHLPQVFAELTAALSFFQDSTDRDNHAKVLNEYGDALLDDRRPAEAMPYLQLALSLFVAEKSLRGQRRVLESLARAATALGDHAAAQDYRRRAQELS